MSRAIRKSLVILTSALLLSACSLSFIYNNLGWLSEWYLDDYVALNKTQQKAFDKAFAELHLWHRKTQLNRYYQQLITFKEQVNKGLTEDDLNQHYSVINNYWFSLREQAKQPLMVLIQRLSDNQKKQILDAIADNNQRRIDDYEQIASEKWAAKQCENVQKQLKKWLGKLTTQQKSIVCKQTAMLEPTFSHWRAYRQRWHGGLETALLLNTDKQQYEMLLTELITQPDALKTAEYRALSTHNNQLYMSIVHLIMNDLTTKQHKTIDRELDQMITQLKSLEQVD